MTDDPKAQTKKEDDLLLHQSNRKVIISKKMADKDEGYDEFLSMLAAAPPTIVDSQEKAVMENEAPSKETCVGLTSDDDHGSPPPSRLSNNQTRLLDHYSLPTPSSTMRFRSANVHVYDSQGSQLILEERLTTRNNSASNNSDETASLGLPNDDGKQEHANISTSSTVTNVTVKKIGNASPELLFLRG